MNANWLTGHLVPDGAARAASCKCWVVDHDVTNRQICRTSIWCDRFGIKFGLSGARLMENLRRKRMISRAVVNFAFLVAAILVLGGCAASPPQDSSEHAVEGLSVGTHVLNCAEVSGHHVFKEEIVCPLGGETFEALRLGTHSTYGVSLDWEPLSYMRFPIPIPVCPSNGFIVLDEEMSSDEVSRVSSVVESTTYQSYFLERHATFFLYAKLSEMLGEDAENRWWLYRQASSEADLCQSPARYREYALLTIEEGEARLADLTSHDNEYWVLSVVIPNMYRRIGDYDAARDWLERFDQLDKPNDGLEQNFDLAFKLLREAITAERSERVPIKEDQP